MLYSGSGQLATIDIYGRHAAGGVKMSFVNVSTKNLVVKTPISNVASSLISPA